MAFHRNHQHLTENQLIGRVIHKLHYDWLRQSLGSKTAIPVCLFVYWGGGLVSAPLLKHQGNIWNMAVGLSAVRNFTLLSYAVPQLLCRGAILSVYEFSHIID